MRGAATARSDAEGCGSSPLRCGNGLGSRQSGDHREGGPNPELAAHLPGWVCAPPTCSDRRGTVAGKHITSCVHVAPTPTRLARCDLRAAAVEVSDPRVWASRWRQTISAQRSGCRRVNRAGISQAYLRRPPVAAIRRLAAARLGQSDPAAAVASLATRGAEGARSVAPAVGSVHRQRKAMRPRNRIGRRQACV
jgi:hypothetical protein